MLLQNRAERDVDFAGKAFPLESSVCDIVHIRTSYAKAGSKAEGNGRVGVADCAAGEHTHESGGDARTRGTEPPTSGGTRVVVLVLNFAVPGGIIGVLCLFARLFAICVGNASENLVLREEEKVIRCRRDCALRRTSVAGVVRVLGNGLEDGAERLRNDCDNRPGIAREARPANVFTHLRARPAAEVRSTAVHGEIAGFRNVRVIGAVA